MRITTRQVWFAAAVVCLFSTAPGRAEVRLAAEGAVKVLCADELGAKHPKRTELHHLVSPDPAATSALLILQYEADDPRNVGRVRANVKLSSLDGSQTGLGRLSVRTDAQTGIGEASHLVPASLGTAAAANWDIRLKKFNQLRPRDCIVVLGAVAAVAGD
jgi:hypothetical protein